MNFTETLQSLTGKPLSDLHESELYLACWNLSGARVLTVCSR